MLSHPFAPSKGVQDSPGFWTPRCGFWIPGAGFRFFCQWNLDSGFRELYSGFQSPRFQISHEKFQDSRIWFPLHAATNRRERSIHRRNHRSNTALRRHVAARNRSVCAEEFLWKSLSPLQFCRRNKSHKIKSDWICATCCGDKIPLLRQRFAHEFPSTRSDLSLRGVAQLIARPACTHGVIYRVYRR